MQLENELFGVPTSLTDRWRTEHEKVNPVTVMNEDGASGDINFQIPASSNGLLSLADIYLEIEVAIKYKKAGEKLGNTSRMHRMLHQSTISFTHCSVLFM